MRSIHPPPKNAYFRHSPPHRSFRLCKTDFYNLALVVVKNFHLFIEPENVDDVGVFFFVSKIRCERVELGVRVGKGSKNGVSERIEMEEKKKFR